MNQAKARLEHGLSRIQRTTTRPSDFRPLETEFSRSRISVNLRSSLTPPGWEVYRKPDFAGSQRDHYRVRNRWRRGDCGVAIGRLQPMCLSPARHDSLTHRQWIYSYIVKGRYPPAPTLLRHHLLQFYSQRPVFVCLQARWQLLAAG
jgi:hypothetical protein